MNVRTCVASLTISICFLLDSALGQTASTAKGDKSAAAPLGLTWAISKTTVRELGVSFVKEENGNSGSRVIARNLPKALSDTETVLLDFGFDDELWKVVIASTKWEKDRYGARARARFEEMVSLLSDRYGNGTSQITSPTSTFHSKPENFAYSLSQNERFHIHQWATNTVDVELSLRAAHENTYYVIIYEYLPLSAKAKSGKRQREKDAL